ncbi:unnamed protein product [Brassica rapa subsp. narinosa]
MWRSRYTSPGRDTVSQPIHYNQCDYRVRHRRFTRLLPLSITPNPSYKTEKEEQVYESRYTKNHISL